MTDATPMLTDDEAFSIVRAAVTAAGPAGQTDAELQQVIGWAIETRVNEAALRLVLDGTMGSFIRREDGEMVWRMLEGQ